MEDVSAGALASSGWILGSAPRRWCIEATAKAHVHAAIASWQVAWAVQQNSSGWSPQGSRTRYQARDGESELLEMRGRIGRWRAIRGSICPHQQLWRVSAMYDGGAHQIPRRLDQLPPAVVECSRARRCEDWADRGERDNREAEWQGEGRLRWMTGVEQMVRSGPLAAHHMARASQ